MEQIYKKLISCSQCFGLFPAKKTVVVDGKRICHECKSKNSKKEKIIK